jgi:hypothetical protein
VDPISGTLFYSMFLMLGYFLLVNILLAILIDAYTSLGTELSDASSKDTVNMGIVEEMVATLRLRLYIGVHGVRTPLLQPRSTCSMHHAVRFAQPVLGSAWEQRTRLSHFSDIDLVLMFGARGLYI